MARSKEESRSSEGMGYRGITVLFASVSGLRLPEARSPCGLGLMLYLFSNSNYSPYGRKRGERNGTPSSGATRYVDVYKYTLRTKYSSLNYYYKVEYLVVAVDDKEEKVRLSLCQAEILKALAQDAELSKQAAVNGNASEEYSLSLEKEQEEFVRLADKSTFWYIERNLFQPFILNSAVLCSKPHRGNHGESALRNFSR